MSKHTDLVDRLHQAHGYLARAEGDLLRVYVSLLALQRFPLHASAAGCVEAILKHLVFDMERTTGNRLQLARDAGECGVDVGFFDVEHFHKAGSA
ncbi:hypothetical protein [Caballeronia zhejiangensis]|uniref:hypothetical protein n=1 Tax=Caballeronia zhejiangensis TaxID=871203 RepID=UPI0012681B08|nr:hypothetical protein [Caballeronia zhejiangensis]